MTNQRNSFDRIGHIDARRHVYGIPESPCTSAFSTAFSGNKWNSILDFDLAEVFIRKVLRENFVFTVRQSSQTERVNAGNWIASNIGISVDSSPHPDRIRLKVAPQGWLIVTEAVMPYSGLGIKILPGKANIVTVNLIYLYRAIE